MNKEEFEKIVNTLREKLDDTTSALLSEDILAILSAYNNTFDEKDTLSEEIEKLKTDKEELLKVNGKLYQKIGFDDITEEKEEEEEKENDEEIDIDDVIDEKGEII
nr:MAG TPA: Phi29 scaffolding protein [Caudoviricetes sp.]